MLRCCLTAPASQALEHKELIGGVGLDSTELGFPNDLFKLAFAQAAAAGLPLVAHAGMPIQLTAPFVLAC